MVMPTHREVTGFMRSQLEMRRRYELKFYSMVMRQFRLLATKSINELELTGQVQYADNDFADRLKISFTDIYREIIDKFGQRVLNTKQIPEFEVLLEYFLLNEALRRIVGISDKTRSDIRNVIILGYRDDLTLPQISSNIEKLLVGSRARNRAATIARTETHSTASYANEEITKSLGIPNQKKIWLATNDPRTRISHTIVSGTEIGIDEKFTVGNAKMKYPGDPEGGAANVINCRCVVLYTSGET